MTPYLIPVIYTLICIGLLYGEAYRIDPGYWLKGKSDKPGSTIIYFSSCTAIYLIAAVVLWRGLGLGVGAFKIMAYISLICSVATRFALFDLILNVARGKELCYNSVDGKTGFALWYEQVMLKIPCWLKLVIRGLLLIAAIVSSIFILKQL